MSKKQLWIIAGPNGSGKSSLVDRYKDIFKENIDFINPDVIAREIEPENPVYPSLGTQIKAGKQAIKLQKDSLNQGKSFAFETTFSGNREIRLIDEAKDKGFKVNLAFVGINSPVKNVERVEERKLKGGHSVDSKDIIRRYDRSMDNLKNSYKKFDRVYIFDNSKKEHKLQAVLEQGKIKHLRQKQPKWITKSIPSIKQSLEKKHDLGR